MGRWQKIYTRLMSGTADAALPFKDVCQLLILFGFSERIQGDHHIFTRAGVEEILNLQPKGGQAKPYQVKQVRNLIRKYRLEIKDTKL